MRAYERSLATEPPMIGPATEAGSPRAEYSSGDSLAAAKLDRRLSPIGEPRRSPTAWRVAAKRPLESAGADERPES